MGIFAGLGELLKNFTTQINDNNLNQDISDDNFVAVAMAHGMSPAAIAEMTRTRNGIQLPTKKVEKKIQSTKLDKDIKEKSSKVIKEKGMER